MEMVWSVTAPCPRSTVSAGMWQATQREPSLPVAWCVWAGMSAAMA